jgi:hypothetical protein
MRRARIVALVAIMVLVAAVPVSAKPAQGVPLKGQSIGFDQEPGPPSGCPDGTSWRYVSEGTGTLSHLGKMSFLATHCTVFDEAAGTGSFGNGTITFTAANGDTLVIAQSGTFFMQGDPISGPFFAFITGEWEVVDGTGRFAGAEGSGEFEAMSDIFGGTTSATYAGRVTYDAANRSN